MTDHMAGQLEVIVALARNISTATARATLPPHIRGRREVQRAADRTAEQLDIIIALAAEIIDTAAAMQQEEGGTCR